jgi:hypothetical protein
MRQYKIIARILLILPIINFAFALPVETHQVCGDVVPRADVATIMSAKRGDKTGEKEGMYFERLFGKLDSGLMGLKGLLPEAPVQGSVDPPQVGTSEVQQVSPKLSKSPSDASLDHYLTSSPASDVSLDHYLTSSPASDAFVPANDYLADSDSGSESRFSFEPQMEKQMEKPKSTSFLSKIVSKLRFWRRISGPGSVKAVVNAARRELQGLVGTGAYVSASSPRVTNVLTL